MSPATIVNKTYVIKHRMSDERQLHLHSHVSMNNWNDTEYIPVVPNYLTNSYE